MLTTVIIIYLSKTPARHLMSVTGRWRLPMTWHDCPQDDSLSGLDISSDWDIYPSPLFPLGLSQNQLSTEQ
jgi:hypothetical protein